MSKALQEVVDLLVLLERVLVAEIFLAPGIKELDEFLSEIIIIHHGPPFRSLHRHSSARSC